MLSMDIVNEYINKMLLMSKRNYWTLMTSCLKYIVCTSSNACIFVIKISPSNFQELLIKASSILLFKYLNFDFHTLTFYTLTFFYQILAHIYVCFRFNFQL